MLYETGAGVRRDEATALDWHRRAAGRGSEVSEIALALRGVEAGEESRLPSNETRWLVPADATSTLWSGATDRSWDGLSCLSVALLGDPFMQYAVGMRFLVGNGVPRDRALGAAWIARARKSFDAVPEFRKYGAATAIIEQRLAQRLGDDEKRRAADIGANLVATVR
nr:SEL1-like repeat protein [Burkholderia ubonensis]